MRRHPSFEGASASDIGDVRAGPVPWPTGAARLPLYLPTMSGLTYRDAGVDIDAGNELVRRIAPAAARTRRPEMLDALGGFAAKCLLPQGYREPVLVVGTDGVGTKLKLAIDCSRHDGVGQDLVAMCANDVLAEGGEPLLFLDYYATGALDVDVAARVIAGIAKGCELAGCALAGGETAEMPDFYEYGQYDLAGFCVGVAERTRSEQRPRPADGDLLIGLASSGPHANGFSLIRRVLDMQASLPSPELLDALLAPTRIYVKSVLPLLDRLSGLCHITGGGFVDNLPRMFDAPLAADIDLASWQRPELFGFLQRAGGIDDLEMLRTFNNGIGFILAVPPAQADAVLEALAASGEDARIIGRMAAADARAAAGRLVVSAAGAQLG